MTVIQVSKVLPNPRQPRTEWNEVELRELAQSIRARRLIQPISVCQPDADGWYVLIDGERRLRAHRLLGLEQIEAVICEQPQGDQEMLIDALVANVQRVDLNPVDEGMVYVDLRRMGWSNVRISAITGVSVARVAHRIKLAELPDWMKRMVVAGQLPISEVALDALMQVPEENREELAVRLAQPGVTVEQIRLAATRFAQALQAEAETLNVPAVDVARRHFQYADKSEWDLLAQIGKLPPWEGVVYAAQKTCQACAWYGTASAVICKDCPAVELVARMMRWSDER